MQRRCAAFTLSTRNETVKPRKAVRNFDFVMFSEHIASKQRIVEKGSAIMLLYYVRVIVIRKSKGK